MTSVNALRFSPTRTFLLAVLAGLLTIGLVASTATLTLALPKVGLIDTPAVGELYLADISVPAIVYRRLGLAPLQLFRDDVVIRLG